MKFIQINLDLTEWIEEHSSILQHDCLHVRSSLRIENDPYQILSYCFSEWPSKWNISIPDNSYRKLIFVDLYKFNITSEQLFLWSTPIDIIENYEYYLSHLNDTSLSEEVYYNCTLPRFGRYVLTYGCNSYSTQRVSDCRIWCYPDRKLTYLNDLLFVT
ncbi:unnamed protein product [Adineta ricciae]|uniref:Uncharacterized protein n=1 Tax=Adineta ricciae TaxID=249248 RepID=A0A815I8C5_ADIRI|nr:unnamed protein product [Adineta ricciae]CAF1494655.1 unnamed protein product [Adineta ricciae]